MFDYQWPSAYTIKPDFVRSKINHNSFKYLKEIEHFFSKKFQYEVKLFPSARAAIAVILRYLQIDRSNTVYTDKWSSHCLFNTIGSRTNVSTTFNKPDLIVCIHKWGVIKKINDKKKFEIIEDSVDSLMLTKKGFFPNNGNFEIFSLPKIIGSISGGLLVTKDKNFSKFCNIEQKKNKNLGVYQSFQKFKPENKKNNYNTWLHYESWNTFMEKNALLDIKRNHKNFEINKKIIDERLKYIKFFLKLKNNFKDRLGPVLPIPIEKFKNMKKLKKIFLIRHNSNELSKVTNFKKYLLLPLHFKIKENQFNKYLKILKKNIKN